jgi:hypothetical protein
MLFCQSIAFGLPFDFEPLVLSRGGPDSLRADAKNLIFL